MPRFRVLITDHAWPDLDVEARLLAQIDAELIIAPPHADQQAMAALARDADAILFCWAPVSRAVIEAAVKCRVLVRMGIGLDNVDLACATERRIPVTRVPDYCLSEVAEHTVALLMALGRKVAHYHWESKAGIYQLRSGPKLRRIAGQTLGLIGFGNIGHEVARRAAALGLRVLFNTPTRRDEPLAQWRSLRELLAESDYVSLHAPLTSATRHLINADALGRMRPTAYLINTSRGGLVDHAALAAALSQQRLAGAALDVQEPEPPDLSQPPFNDPRVIVTPHAAFASEESLLELRRRATQQVIDALEGRRPENVVNGAPCEPQA